MNKYEYILEANLSIDKINEYGQIGWELVSVTTPEACGYYNQFFYFKRILT